MSPLEWASGLALRHLQAAQVEALRKLYLRQRARLAPAMRWVHGSFSADDLRAHLEERTCNQFELLMVHSSFNHMLPMYSGTALELVKMLLSWCGPKRTLVMPAFYFGEPGQGGAFGTFSQEPRFDLRRAPSQMGLVTELFRRSPGVLFSRHPVYRMSALGPLAAELTKGHEFAQSPAGLGTPFEFMANHDTCIIGIGKPMQVLTQAHHVEGLMGEEFPVPSVVAPPLPMVLMDRNQEFPFLLTRRAFQGRFNIWRLRRMMDKHSLQEWRFHHVPMFATRARVVTDALVASARKGVTLYEPV